LVGFGFFCFLRSHGPSVSTPDKTVDGEDV
jgi:hypothetical protein